jgi:hypothetical protein
MASNDLINIGKIANDGTGDELRIAFRKINQKFNDVDFRIGDTFEVINGGTGVGLFVERIEDNDDDSSNNDVLFRSLVAGDNITIAPNADPSDQSVVISAPGALTTTPFETDSGTYALTTGNSIRLFGGTGINTRVDSNDNIIVDNTGLIEVVEDTSPALGGQLNADGNSIVNANSITATDFIGGTFRGKLIGTVEDADTADINSFFTDLDFGGFNQNITSFYDFLIESTDVDLGTVGNPANLAIDQGLI